MSKTFVGSRVRQLRSERGFSQAALAQMLDISPSYLNQIEHDVRPLTVAVLLRITEVFGVDATFFASQDDTRLVAELREVTMDRDLDIDIDPPEVAEMVSAHPTLARAVVNLHRRYRITTAQLAAATEERYSDGSGTGSITMPHEEVRDYFYQRQNYLHELDTAAEDLTVQMRLHHGDLARELTRRLTEVHGVHINRRIDLGDTVLHRFDADTKTLEISNHLSTGQQVFKMAAELAYLEFGDLIDSMVEEGKFTSDESHTLARLGLANYFAGRGTALPSIPRRRREFPLRRRAAVGVLLGELRNHRAPALDAATTVDARRAVLFRPSGPRRKYVKTPVCHRFSLLLQRRDLSAVECVRDVCQSRQDPGADRADARRPQLHVGGPDGGTPRCAVWSARQNLCHRAWLRTSSCASTRLLGRTRLVRGPEYGSHTHRRGLPCLRT